MSLVALEDRKRAGNIIVSESGSMTYRFEMMPVLGVATKGRFRRTTVTLVTSPPFNQAGNANVVCSRLRLLQTSSDDPSHHHSENRLTGKTRLYRKEDVEMKSHGVVMNNH